LIKADKLHLKRGNIQLSGDEYLSSSKRISVFKEDGLEKLSFEYVPSRLPHRERYVDDLIKFFRITIDQLGVISERILIFKNWEG